MINAKLVIMTITNDNACLIHLKLIEKNRLIHSITLYIVKLVVINVVINRRISRNSIK